MPAGTVTLRSTTQAGATTANRRLTVDELDSNFLFLQSGTGATSQIFQDEIRRFGKQPQQFGASADNTTDDITDVQEAVDAIPLYSGATPALGSGGHTLLIQPATICEISNDIDIGVRRLILKGSGGLGAGGSGFRQTDVNADIIDYASAHTDAISMYGLLLEGASADGTGRGAVIGSAGTTVYDSRIDDVWFVGIPAAAIDGVNIEDYHITNCGFDSSGSQETTSVKITKGSYNLVGFCELYGQSGGIVLNEGNSNLFAVNKAQTCGFPNNAASDTTGAVYLDAGASKLLRGNSIIGWNFSANANDIVLDGNTGDWASNTGVDGTLVAGCVSDRATRRFALLTDAHKSSIVSSLIVDPGSGAGSQDAIELAGDCDGVFIGGGVGIVSITGAGPFYEYGIRIGSSVALAVLGEVHMDTGSKGRVIAASGAHVKALPGSSEYERFMVKHFDDFLGAALDGRWGNKVGSDAQVVAPAITAEVGGAVAMTSGDDAAASMAVNGVQMDAQLNWQANKGSLIFEAKVKLSAITNVSVFVGLTDQIAALEMPINASGVGNGTTNNATDAVGFMFDTSMTDDNWWLVSTGAADEDSSTAPSAGTYQTFRIEFTGNGAAVKFYINGTQVGSQMNAPVTQTTALTPVIAAFSRAAASRTITTDYVLVESERGT